MEGDDTENTDNRDNMGSLVEQLTDLLDNARARVALFFMAGGLAPTVTQKRLAVFANRDGPGWHSEYVDVDANVLSLRVPVAFPEALADWLDDARSLSENVARRLPVAALPHMALPPPGLDLVGMDPGDLDEGEPAQRVLGQVILSATRWYLTHTPSIATPDCEMAKIIATDTIKLLAAGEWQARQSVAILGLQPERDLMECDGNRLRLLSPLERGDFLSLEPRPHGMGSLGARSMMPCPSHLLEMDREAGPPNKIGSLPTPPLLMALRLHQIEFAGPGVLVTYLLPEWLSFGYSSKPLPMPPGPSRTCTISQEQMAEACCTAGLLARYRFDSPERPSDLALHRFGLGCGRPDPADGLLDFVVALEALLLPYDQEVRLSDLSYRFRLHGAHFISDSCDERRSIFRTLRKLYEMRSRLVHGGKCPTAAETLTAANEARDLAARGLLKAVRTGFPNVEQFNQLALGEETDI
jgi:hypothetical protein